MIKTILPGKEPAAATTTPSLEVSVATAATPFSEVPVPVPTCYQCGRALSPDEIALHKRIINRGATSHLCLTCLAAYFDCSEDLLRDKIEHFRKMGCTLFEPNL